MNMQSQLASPPPGRWTDQRLIDFDGAAESARVAHEPERRRCGRTAFEIQNVSGKLARGVEIELAGFGEHDVFRAYYLNRYGTLGVIRTADSIRVRFESLWKTAARTLSQTNLVHEGGATQLSRPFIWQFALCGGGGSERFCLETSTRDVIATYWWLVATDASGDTLVAETAPACVQDARTDAAWIARAGR